ncbi:flagellar assembly protein FliH [Roseivivax halotolerans]|jgi:flagellar assembly protein FliH|uniref:Flagellar assembly protein FliH n=1 Tax=Roseivivax halotolerans TaxID=93684 RepID=A0A1I5VAV3_9RHOB|nr:ABC transporter ATP-binding protein [Roseivivax halotolerans]SFQ04521.1 flagellar assembly protein FliH [Roseivivax halotolerans]
MMPDLSAFFPDFASPAPGLADTTTPRLPPDELEKRDLANFDQGYRSGWDDAVRTMEEENTRIKSDFAQNLQDLSFTYHEAYSHILAAMTPLLDEIVGAILPAALQGTLGAHVAARMGEVAAEIGNLNVRVAVSPTELSLVEPLADNITDFPVEVVADGSLAAGQADIRFSETVEERLDLSEIAEEIRTAIAGFCSDTRRAVNG